ncbi:MAG: NUDIX hydrolase [Pseudodonghicola sp.]
MSLKTGKLRKQYGALPFIQIGGKLRIVLITSRTHQNWIFPKGNRIPGRSGADSALQEAREEAGLIGRRWGRMKLRGIVDHPDGKIDLTLYPMRVERIRSSWAEAHQRRRVLVSVREGEQLLTFKASRRMLRQWAAHFRTTPGSGSGGISHSPSSQDSRRRAGFR